MKAWGTAHIQWIESIKAKQPAHQDVLIDYLYEVKHVKDRIARLEKLIDERIATAPPEMQKVIAALQTLRGIAKIGAATLVTEVGRFSRFETASQFMAYAGVVPREHSSGGDARRGRITKTGNSRVRHIVGEAAWQYRHHPRVAAKHRRRQQGQSQAILDIAWKAQQRLCGRYQSLSGRKKAHGTTVIAIGRELLGFIWAIAREVEAESAVTDNTTLRLKKVVA